MDNVEKLVGDVYNGFDNFIDYDISVKQYEKKETKTSYQVYNNFEINSKTREYHKCFMKYVRI
jgi:hypothetical protein